MDAVAVRMVEETFAIVWLKSASYTPNLKNYVQYIDHLVAKCCIQESKGSTRFGSKHFSVDAKGVLWHMEGLK